MHLALINDAVEGLFDLGVFVGEYFFPVHGRDDVESHSGLEVWLVEEGEDSTGVVSLELGVKILFSVDVNKAHTATSVVIVFVAIKNRNLIVVNSEFIDFEEQESVLGVDLNWLIVEKNFKNVGAFKVETEFRWDFVQGESYL
jgi:hypothetical protein